MLNANLAGLLREAAALHHDAEMRLPAHDWADWYAAYLKARTAVEPADPVIAGTYADIVVRHAIQGACHA